jgi:hypothetical protein
MMYKQAVHPSPRRTSHLLDRKEQPKMRMYLSSFKLGNRPEALHRIPRPPPEARISSAGRLPPHPHATASMRINRADPLTRFQSVPQAVRLV